MAASASLQTMYPTVPNSIEIPHHLRPFVDFEFDEKSILPFEEIVHKQPEFESKLRALTTLRNSTPDAMTSSKFQNLFRECLQICQTTKYRLGYRALAFATLGGIDDLVVEEGSFRMGLYLLIFDPKAKLNTIHTLLDLSFTNQLKKITRISQKVFASREYYLSNPQDNLNEGEEIIHFNHGGGFQSIHHMFQTKDWSGYFCQEGQVGVWISPEDSSLAHRGKGLYSLRASSHFDVPCMMTGSISKKYTLSCFNSYELFIPYQNIEKVFNISIKPLIEQTKSQLFISPYYKDLKSKIEPEVYQDVQDCYCRLSGKPLI